MFKPGQLDWHYHQGYRVGLVKPVALFLMINVLYFMFSTMTDFAIQFSRQLRQPYWPLVADFVQSLIVNSGLNEIEIVLKIPLFMLQNIAVWWPSLAINPLLIHFNLMPVGLLLYIVLSGRKMYQQSWLQMLWKTPLVLAVFVFSHLVYRFIQLLVVMLMVNGNG